MDFQVSFFQILHKSFKYTDLVLSYDQLLFVIINYYLLPSLFKTFFQDCLFFLFFQDSLIK